MNELPEMLAFFGLVAAQVLAVVCARTCGACAAQDMMTSHLAASALLPPLREAESGA